MASATRLLAHSLGRVGYPQCNAWRTYSTFVLRVQNFKRFSFLIHSICFLYNFESVKFFVATAFLGSQLSVIIRHYYDLRLGLNTAVLLLEHAVCIVRY
jgi:hypothetical protein